MNRWCHKPGARSFTTTTSCNSFPCVDSRRQHLARSCSTVRQKMTVVVPVQIMVIREPPNGMWGKFQDEIVFETFPRYLGYLFCPAGATFRRVEVVSDYFLSQVMPLESLKGNVHVQRWVMGLYFKVACGWHVPFLYKLDGLGFLGSCCSRLRQVFPH